jgi:hypothetical protein
MVNGHNMADNFFDYMLFFGNGFPIDMNLIKQIEIIRNTGESPLFFPQFRKTITVTRAI